MNNTKKDKKKITHFRLSLLDAKTHQQLFSVRFNRTGFFVSAVTIAVVLCAAIFSLIAFTPVRTFIPGYPDARTKRAAIQNAIKVDSLESVIYRWELYSENLRRVVEGEEPMSIDSIIAISNRRIAQAKDPDFLKKQDSIMRQEVKNEEMFDISSRSQRQLPIEGMLFFTPVQGVISQGYDPVIHPYLDIAAPAGTVVKAIANGTVIFDGWSEETGYTIQIQHDGDIVSIYKHNEKLLKKTGDKVSAGSPIALVGNTGKLTTGEHLHFELWHKGESLDPTRYISF
ncbi:MAG: M23 family metallopeptidase [Bacteroidales bacterium]|nr:M23 family metallopeptidase [Bacteroidales bacterium]